MAFKVNQKVWTGELLDGRPLLGPAKIWFTFNTTLKRWIIKRLVSSKVNHRFGDSLLRTYVLKWFTFSICPNLWVVRVPKMPWKLKHDQFCGRFLLPFMFCLIKFYKFVWSCQLEAGQLFTTKGLGSEFSAKLQLSKMHGKFQHDQFFCWQVE